jgi:UDP-N-acetylmuramoyl-L-alanyl-D-glutamate--2,6-diaminopimelate ligase
VPLSAAVAAVPGARIRGDGTTPIAEAAFDTRSVPASSLFFCIPGRRVDGHDLAPEALRRGAVAVVVARWLELDAPQVLVPSVRRAMGPISAEIFGRPAETMTVTGVTGTNGKTTVVHLLDAVFRASGLTTGAIGTVGAHAAGEAIPLARTTPEAPDLHRVFARMRDAGVAAVAMEVSSHALGDDRVGGVMFDAAVFTNLSQDHLDHHGTMDAYFAAKASLFAPDRTRRAVVNVDDPWGRRLLPAAVPVVTYGLDPSAEVRAEDLRATTEGLAFRVGGRAVASPLRGAFNVWNCLATIAVARVLGIDDDAIARGLADADHVPGRMEPIDARDGSLVVVDYAHTPDSIRNVLAAARPLATGRVIVVFGCGGDRDRGKRFPMGAAATQGADLAVITTDNPRSEDPRSIIDEVARGAAAGGGRYEVEPERRAAIRLALERAGPGDVVVIAGKGHETQQEFADAAVPFDDRVVAREELERIRSGR